MHDANTNVVLKVLDEAHGSIDVGYRALSSAYQLDGTVQFPSYELCTNESELEEYQGRMVVAVAFTSERDFLPDAIESHRRKSVMTRWQRPARKTRFQTHVL
jgi:hypothetical protein